ncbi:Hypothetical Protein FCC1311_055552 [Hondaea fermentalgiana]|uniref:Uncharacterized protein n=1 Tax=Hondaea fermentalgiana TaxID=2315210 RepID=A0A2R5GL33_9STRA|nr:Hypothetical Protein FCC1311_055552 [Hondaea fermentalgiana]|eukprot:GBG29333.1 Hypothetical Protein FCC1311_055552 [Hondaea fermentalgiana]
MAEPMEVSTEGAAPTQQGSSSRRSVLKVVASINKLQKKYREVADANFAKFEEYLRRNILDVPEWVAEEEAKKSENSKRSTWAVSSEEAALDAELAALEQKLEETAAKKCEVKHELNESKARIRRGTQKFENVASMLEGMAMEDVHEMTIKDAGVAMSLTIPFAGLHICFNIGFARILNHEEFTSRQVGFTFIILVGVTVVLVSGNHDTVSFTVKELEDLFREVPFIVTTSIILLAMMVLAPIAFFHSDARAECLCSSALVGTVGSCTQVFAKTMAESFDEAVETHSSSIFDSFVPSVAIVVTSLCALAQLTMLNVALSRFNAFVVVPIVNATMIVLGSLYAAIFFKEFHRFDLESKILMPVGILTTAVGVALLAWDHDPERSSELITGSPAAGVALTERPHSFGGYRNSYYEHGGAHGNMHRSPSYPAETLHSTRYHHPNEDSRSAAHEDLHRIEPLEEPLTSHRSEEDDDDNDGSDRATSLTLS